MKDWPRYMRTNRPKGLCESGLWTGPRRNMPCLNRARWRRRSDAPTDQGARMCGVHARAFTPESLVEIGTPGWESA